jgi:hypothetical protein
LEIIHADEVTHVTAGHRWFIWACKELEGLEGEGAVVNKFKEEVRTNFSGRLKGPFNEVDREKAGLSKAWWEELSGVEKSGLEESLEKKLVLGDRENEVRALSAQVKEAVVDIEYEH